jgi:hypothetical protein
LTNTTDTSADQRSRHSSGVVFLDVGTAWRSDDTSRMIEHLASRIADGNMEVLAVGDWGTVPPEVPRLLARHGATLIAGAEDHGCGSRRGVPLAVAAGVWLASCHPGAVLEIVTDRGDEHAFDSIEYMAARRGVIFRRVTPRSS